MIKQHKLNLNVPIINWTTENNEYIGFYGVEGKSIKETMTILSIEQKQEIGTSIGIFLKQLHSIKNYDNPNVMTIADWIDECQEKYSKAKEELYKHFYKTEIKIIDNLFMIELPEKMSKFDEDLAFCHGDLSYNNILLGRNNNAGIIDFGDAGLYDSHQDFGGLEDEIIRIAAYNAYGANDRLIEKVNIHLKVVPFLDLLYYIGKNNSAGIKECIDKIKINIFPSIEFKTKIID